MRTEDRSPSLPGWRMVQGGVTRIRRWFSAAPLIVKILLVVALIFLSPAVLSVALVGGLIYAPFAVAAGHRSVVASLSVAVWGLALVSGLSGGSNSSWFGLLLLLPFVVVAGRARGPARPLVRAVPHRRLDARLGPAGRHHHPAARGQRGVRGPGRRVADRVRGAGLAAGQGLARGAGVRPSAGAWRRPGRALRLAPAPATAVRRPR